jgi:hypothetical protein
MSARLTSTLGEHIQPKPAGGAPSFSKQHVKDIAKAAIKSMIDTRQVGNADRDGDFQSGVLTTTKMMTDNESEGTTGLFSDTPKGEIMGFSGATKWRDVQRIWLEAEKVK